MNKKSKLATRYQILREKYIKRHMKRVEFVKSRYEIVSSKIAKRRENRIQLLKERFNKINAIRTQVRHSSVSKLFKCLIPHTKLVVFALCLAAIGAGLRLSAPFITQQISKIILESSQTGVWDFASIYKFSALNIATFVGAFLFDYAQLFIIIGVTTKVSNSLRMRLANKINCLPLKYFDNCTTGQILAHITNDVDNISQALNSTLSGLVTSLITVIGSVAILFAYSWIIGLVALASIPIDLLLLFLVSKRSQMTLIERHVLNGEISSMVDETYAGFNIVKAFNVDKVFMDKFSQINYELKRSNFRAETYLGTMIPLVNFFSNIIFAIICLIAGFAAGRAGGDPVAVSMVVAAVSYGGQMISPMCNLANLFATFQRAIAAATRVFDMLDQKNEPDESHKTTKIKKVRGNVSFAHVKFGYNPNKTIIKDFSQTVKQGQKIAIVGPTGAGKTTLVNLLMRFYEINNGQISIEGIDTTKMNRSYVRSLFGMVLQDTWLFSGTIMDNLKFSRRDAKDEEVYKACKITHCDEFIKQAGGYNKVIKEECALSSGQKQLLTIARAMIQNAPMLILDEATSNVDTRTEILIQDAMDKLMKGRTSFVIAHRLSTIKNADLIIVMKDGDVVECGKHNQLLAKKGLYADIYNSQFSSNKA